MARAITGTSAERTGRLMVIAALVFAALAAILVFVALHNRGGSGGSSAVATQDVVVAKQDISVNTKLTADMVEAKALPSNQIITGAYATTQGIIGLPARYPIQSGEQITSTKLGVKAIVDEKDMALVLTGGQRAFSVTASEVTAVGGLLLPGNNVDVIAVFGDPNNNAAKRAVTVLQNIQILSVAQEAQQPVPAASDTQATPNAPQGLQGQRPSDVKRQPGASSITLAVTPEQAQLLAALQTQGNVNLWLSLRPAGDTSNVPIGETNLSQFNP
jgi:Flp pilus assembly protein CpaB